MIETKNNTALMMGGLLKVQEETNVAYFGTQWRDNWTNVVSTGCIYAEWAEFLEEVTADWKIYDPAKKFVKTKAVYELVDVCHFMLSHMLINTPSAQEGFAYWGRHHSDWGWKKATLEDTTQWFTYFMGCPSVYQFLSFIQTACNYLQISVETYVKAHMRKNERNRIRAASGVMEGKYDKSKEQPLTLEF